MEPVFLLAAAALALIVAGILLKLRPAPKPVNSIYAATKAGKLGAGGGKGKMTLSVVANAAAEKDARPSVRLLYGTQTGTAERFAKQLGAELRARYGGEAKVRVEVTDAEHYFAGGAALDERLERESVLLLLFATYGDGEPTDNAADLYSWITTEVDEVEGGAKNAYLHNVNFGVFGLGNKQYEHFNAVGKRLHSALSTLGASALVPRGDGDDDDCIDDDFDRWTSSLFGALDGKPALLGGAAALAGSGASALQAAPPAYAFEVLPAAAAGAGAAPPRKLAAPFGAAGVGTSVHDVLVSALVTESRELHTPASGRSCVHVEIDVSAARPPPPGRLSSAGGPNGGGAFSPRVMPRTPLAGGARYATGDHVAVLAHNSDAAVAQAAELLGLPLDTVFTLRRPSPGEAGATAAAAELPDPFPTPATLEGALRHFADLHASPHREALSALASVASSAEEAARLRRLASREAHEEYSDYVTKARRSLLEVLADHPSCSGGLGLGLFFGSVAPRLQPRYYSISSSSLRSPTTVSVTAAVVRDVMPATGRVHEGVATTCLARAVPGETRASVFLRRSNFKLPADPQAPLLMIGPGTGLAPFRAFIQERAEILRTGGAADGRAPPSALGPAVLFFGCRRADHDYIYEQELREAASRGLGGPLSALHVAFSREPAAAKAGGGKQYVQHLMEREGAGLWPLMQAADCHVYVCGDAKAMAKDVHRALVAVAQRHGKMGTAQAEAYIKAMADGGRYQKDVW